MWVNLVVGFLQALPKLIDLVDKGIGAIRKNREEKKKRDLEIRQEDRRNAKRELQEAKDKKAKRAAMRKLTRLG